ncbi:serine/threonine-protein kinase [Nocardiopsis sp. RSe5-2]|uniref:Serine/threonine-protein kinase n=1 Tax=Nocardiopsis endophytica TaxID=3018445 RepID=A0ABT4U0S5_9ACTN|nr:serine/threonine-protein kinase [Nocardiopsis endophytica]MDA2810540.1 serine/threonine-protein kinase [Nocardiopsis endophytica]
MTSNGHDSAKPLRTGDPRELGDYTVLGRLGRGGMGTVYLARSPEGRRVAVKLIHPDLTDDEDFRRRFAREVESARRVARFSTAGVLDARLDGEPLFIVSEYVPGPNLAEAVAAEGPMAGGTLDGLAMGVAAALTAIHGAGVIHRDLKPANVLLSTVGPKVIDFGIARAMEDDGAVTRSSQLMGTPAYLAPELIAGQDITPASDIFSWGCLVAFAGTGRAPFDAPSVPAVLHQITSMAPELGDLEAPLRDMVAAALSKDPTERPTAQQLLNRLVGQEDPDESVVDQTVVRSWTPPSTARPTQAMAAPTAAGAAAAGAAAGAGDGDTPTSELGERPTAAMPPPGATQAAPPQDTMAAAPPTMPYAPPQYPSGPQPPVPGGVPQGGVPSGPQQPPGPPPHGYAPGGPGMPGGPGSPTGPGGPGVPSPPHGGPAPFAAGAPGGPGMPGGPGTPPGGQASPGGRKRPSKAVLGLVAAGAVLVLVAAGGAAVYFTRDPQFPADADSIHQQDFDSGQTDWTDEYSYEFEDDSAIGHIDQAFAMRATEDDDEPTVRASAPIGDKHPVHMAATVDLVWDSGPDYSEAGMYCFGYDADDNRYEEDYRQYEVRLRKDGKKLIIRRNGGSEEGEGTLARVGDVPGYDATEGATNTLQITCDRTVEEGQDIEDGTVTVRAWVNGEFAAEATDDNPVLGRGTGLLLSRSGGSGDDAVARFDDYELFRTADATKDEDPENSDGGGSGDES